VSWATQKGSLDVVKERSRNAALYHWYALPKSAPLRSNSVQSLLNKQAFSDVSEGEEDHAEVMACIMAHSTRKGRKAAQCTARCYWPNCTAAPPHASGGLPAFGIEEGGPLMRKARSKRTFLMQNYGSETCHAALLGLAW